MPDETLTPVIREEEFLAAIAGDGQMPDPVIRKEEFLAAIGGRVDDLSDAVDALEDIVPTPAAGDNGKVLTAGADGTASWGGGVLVMKCTGTGEETADGILVPLDTSMADLMAALMDFTPIFVAIPAYTDSSPYYNYQSGATAMPLWSPAVPNNPFYEDLGGYVYSLSIGGTGLALLRTYGSN